jgi:hypothetical protein
MVYGNVYPTNYVRGCLSIFSVSLSLSVAIEVLAAGGRVSVRVFSWNKLPGRLMEGSFSLCSVLTLVNEPEDEGLISLSGERTGTWDS